MLIIIEGPDGAGKTTLIETIRQNLKRYFWIARSSHPPKRLHEITTFLQTFEGRPSDVMGLLFDRHPLISDPIYGPILRNQDLLAIQGDYTRTLRMLQRHLFRIDRNPLIIYCRPPLDTIATNVRKNADEQLEGVVERIQPIVDAYDRMMTVLIEGSDRINIWKYDYTQYLSQEILINNLLKRFEE